MNSDNMINDQ